MQHHAADQLHVEMAHAQHAARSLAADGERFGQDAVQIRALGDALFEFGRFGLQRGIVRFLHLRFERVDFRNGFAVLFQQAVVAAAEYFFGELCEHVRKIPEPCKVFQRQ